MRGKSELKSNDSGQLKVFLFGGILGDHPPRDRTKLLRHNTETLKHLGVLQLSTDTAVLAVKLILLNGLQL
jgi:ribosome biogenesis SPOUT family RNA methylase Rps3